MDVCGPLQVPSTGGAKYIATFLDDYPKLSIVRAITQKSGVAQTVQEVLQMLGTSSGNSESDADDPAAAVKEEADTAAEVVAKEAVEEEGRETTAAAPEHRYHLCLTKKDSVSNPRLRSLGRLCKLLKLTSTLYSSV